MNRRVIFGRVPKRSVPMNASWHPSLNETDAFYVVAYDAAGTLLATPVRMPKRSLRGSRHRPVLMDAAWWALAAC
jgi:hypothetical protein